MDTLWNKRVVIAIKLATKMTVFVCVTVWLTCSPYSIASSSSPSVIRMIFSLAARVFCKTSRSSVRCLWCFRSNSIWHFCWYSEIYAQILEKSPNFEIVQISKISNFLPSSSISNFSLYSSHILLVALYAFWIMSRLTFVSSFNRIRLRQSLSSDSSTGWNYIYKTYRRIFVQNYKYFTNYTLIITLLQKIWVWEYQTEMTNFFIEDHVILRYSFIYKTIYAQLDLSPCTISILSCTDNLLWVKILDRSRLINTVFTGV